MGTVTDRGRRLPARRTWMGLLALIVGLAALSTPAVGAALPALTPVPQATLTLRPTPKISDTTPTVDQVVQAVPGSWGPAPVTLAYQWYKVSSTGTTSTLTGATSAAYKVAGTAAGYRLKVKVTASKPGYTTTSKTSALTSAVAKAVFSLKPTPTVTGTARVGMTLTAQPGAYRPTASYAYAWYRGTTAISGATKATYVATSSDRGQQLKVRVKASRTGYVSVTQYSALTAAVVAGVFTAKPVPTITGTVVIGGSLTATEGAWSPRPDSFAYQWYRSGSAITGATARAYQLAQADAGTALTVKVTARKAGFTSASVTSVPVTLTNSSESSASDLRVASFNISGANNDVLAGGDHQVWAERRPVVIAQIIGENPDVVGLQEAYEGTLQYLGLRDALNAVGKTYEITDLDPATSKATRILYNTSTLSLLTGGAFEFTAQVAGKTPRYLVWATFQQRATGKQVFFVSTHLSPDDTTVRAQQWRELISKVQQLNSGNLPVVLVGDFNTSKFSAAAAEFLPAMKSAGFGDVMNQEYKVNPPINPRAELVVNGWINSFNDYRRDITPFSYPTARTKVGNGIDWIFATNSMRVRSWKVVIDFNPTTLLINGIIPSDHSMISSVVVL